MSTSARIGTFLLLIAAILMVLFIYSDTANDPQFKLLIYGVLLTIVGMILRLTAPRPAPPQNTRPRLFGKRQKKERNERKDVE